jgi:heme exporter protein D
MNEFLAMGGHSPYVWTAYGITLVVVIGNIWAARARLRRALRAAARDSGQTEPERRPKVSQL